MQSPPKPCAFESDLALLLSAFVAEKQRLGFKYNSIEAYLKSFDTFLLGKDCKNSLSKELRLEWIAPKAHQSATTIEHRIHIMQRLADFLNRNGFPAYRISSELIPRKTHDFIAKVSKYVALGCCAQTGRSSVCQPPGKETDSPRSYLHSKQIYGSSLLAGGQKRGYSPCYPPFQSNAPAPCGR